MNKFRKNILIITGALFILAIVGFSFYWLSIRPENIRKGCSFVKRHEDAKEEIKGSCGYSCWSAEYKAQREKCDEKIRNEGNLSGAVQCMEDAGMSYEPVFNRSSPAKLARDYVTPATEVEYNTCLHSKGL